MDLCGKYLLEATGFLIWCFRPHQAIGWFFLNTIFVLRRRWNATHVLSGAKSVNIFFPQVFVLPSWRAHIRLGQMPQKHQLVCIELAPWALKKLVKLWISSSSGNSMDFSMLPRQFWNKKVQRIALCSRWRDWNMERNGCVFSARLTCIWHQKIFPFRKRRQKCLRPWVQRMDARWVSIE